MPLPSIRICGGEGGAHARERLSRGGRRRGLQWEERCADAGLAGAGGKHYRAAAATLWRKQRLGALHAVHVVIRGARGRQLHGAHAGQVVYACIVCVCVLCKKVRATPAGAVIFPRTRGPFTHQCVGGNPLRKKAARRGGAWR